MSADPVNAVLEDWNQLGAADAAAEAILPCNGSRAWAVGMAARRPFDTPEDLFAASDWSGAASPKTTGSRPSTPIRASAKPQAKGRHRAKRSRGPPASRAQPPADSCQRSRARPANSEYEAKFGRIFIVCATGKSAAEILAPSIAA